MRMNKAIFLSLCVVALATCSYGEKGTEMKQEYTENTGDAEQDQLNNESTFTAESRIVNVMEDPAFQDYGRLIFPVDMEIDQKLRLKDVSSILPWYSEVNVSKTVEISADGRIRNVVSKEDAIKFIKSIPDINQMDIPNERMREQEYKAAILSGDNKKIVSIIKLLYARKQERIDEGKKVTTADDRYFKQAEEMFFSELSFVLDIPKKNMEQFIADTISS